MSSISRTIAGIAFAAALGAGALGTAALAQDAEAKKAIEARQAVMKQIGQNTKALSDLIKSGSGDLAAEAQKRSGDIRAAAAQVAAAFKPEFHVENAADIKNAALPVIWTDAATFETRTKDLQDASAALGAAAENGDLEQIKTAFVAMTKTCGGCHGTFRQKSN